MDIELTPPTNTQMDIEHSSSSSDSAATILLSLSSSSSSSSSTPRKRKKDGDHGKVTLLTWRPLAPSISPYISYHSYYPHSDSVLPCPVLSCSTVPLLYLFREQDEKI